VDRLTPKERTLLAVLALVQFTHITDFVILMPLGPQLIRVFGFSAAQFSVLVSAYALSAAVCSLTAALFLDRWDRKTTLLWLYAGFLFGTALCGFASSYYQLLLGRVLAGAFGGCVGSVVLAIVGDSVPAERRGRAMGIVMTAFSVATVFGLPLGLAAAAHLGWAWVFFGIAVVGVFILVIAFAMLEPCRFHLAKARTETPFQELASILSSRINRLGLLMVALVVGTTFMVVPFLSPSLVVNVGVREDQLSWIYLVGGLCTFVSTPWIGRLSDSLGHSRVFLILALLSLGPVVLITHLGPTPLWQTLTLTSFFMMLGGSRMVPVMSILTSLVPAHRRGAYMSLVSVAQQTALGLASFAVGRIVVTEPSGRLAYYPVAGWVSVCLSGVALFVLFWIQKSSPVPKTPSPL
jgi:predicted MFS family arabinose efflux permease